MQTLNLAPGESAVLGKTIRLAVQTTRKPYPGEHRAEALFNGRPHPLGTFVLKKAGT